jgi:hypothetical protein
MENPKENSILIWYVMPHKDVSRAIGLIDNSLRRSSLQRTFVEESNTLPVNGSVCPHHSCIVLDPSGNVLLKIYDICGKDIDSTAWDDDSWTPRLHLTAEERIVIENKETTLLLGCSGTGKTVCICNRMDFDPTLLSCLLRAHTGYVLTSRKLSGVILVRLITYSRIYSRI